MNILFDIHTLVHYLYHRKPELTKVKLHKSLYFLYAYHGAMYGQEDECRLYDATIEAWKYGPVVREVYDRMHENLEDTTLDNLYNVTYMNHLERRKAVKKVNENIKVKLFIDDLLEQIASVSDFSLVDRSKQDEAYQLGTTVEGLMIDKEQLIKEYKEVYMEA